MANMRYQPQGLVRLDRLNPLLRGAQAVVTASASTNLASSKALVTNTPLSGFTPAGKVFQFRKSSWVATESFAAIGTQTFVEFWYGYPSGAFGNLGANDADPTFLTGSSVNNTAIVARIGSSRPNSTTWGSLYNWDNQPASQFLSSGDVLTVGKLTLLVVVRRQNVMEFWRDGRLLQSTAIALTNLAASSFIVGAFIADNYWTSESDALLAGRVVADWSADQIKVFSANPWQLFEAPEEDEYLVTAAAPASISGTLAATLPAPTMSSTGLVAIPGTLAATLAAPTFAASGIAATPPSGSFAATMAAPVMSAAAIATNYAQLAATMAAPTMTATGTAAPHATGTLTFTMPAPTMNAFGFLGANAPAAPVRPYRWRILRRHFVVT